MDLRSHLYNPPREHVRVERLCDAPFIDELVTFYQWNEATTPWSNTHPTLQSSVQTHLVNSDDVMAGCGAATDLPAREQDFKHLALRYHDTVVQKVLSHLPFEVRRLRWMRLMGKSCYSIHRDPTPRIHIPVYSKQEACFVFPEYGAIHLEVGGVYLVDTTQYHTFINGHSHQRVHLVGVPVPKD